MNDRMAGSKPGSNNLLVDCGKPHCELLDLELGVVWQSHGPITQEAYDALELPAKWIKVGIGVGVMDEHFFRRSPGANEDGPLAEREVDGHLFIHCANPPAGGPETPVGPDPRLLRVDKHHSLIFAEGRSVQVLRDTDGRDYVQVIGASPEGGGVMQEGPAAEAHPPEGWSLRHEPFEARTTIDLPHPTQAWFFANGESFQGPVDTFGGRVDE